MGEPNATQIVELNRPAVLRCLAGGYPAPHVGWWREKDYLALEDENYRINADHSLEFFDIKLTDLGTYTCQAYSLDRPASIQITLNAIGPIAANTPEEEPYLKYVIQQPQVPSIPTHRPVIRPIVPPSRDLQPPPVESPRYGNIQYHLNSILFYRKVSNTFLIKFKN